MGKESLILLQKRTGFIVFTGRAQMALEKLYV